MNECSEFDRNNQGRRNASNFGGQSLKKTFERFLPVSDEAKCRSANWLIA